MYHGGDFGHVPHKTYTSDIYKKYEDVDVENMVVEELKDSLVDIMGEYDSLFFCTDGKFIKNGISLLCNGSKNEAVEKSKLANGFIILYVYHLPKDLLDNFGNDMSEIGYEAERGSGEMRRLEQEVNEAESEREEDVIESESERGDCSDDEFIEIRKATKAARKKIQQEEENY